MKRDEIAAAIPCGEQRERFCQGWDACLEELELFLRQPKKAPREPKKKAVTGALTFFASHTDLLKNVSQELQQRWIETYKDMEWINSELSHAGMWLEANKKNRPNKGAFLTNWLKRATPPTTQPTFKGSFK